MHHSYVDLMLTRLRPVHKLMPRPVANIAKLVLRPLDSINARKYPPHVFADVDVYCLFIGYLRSGHTLVAQLLDAHPNIIISNEMDVLGYVERGFNQTQVFH